MSAYTGLPCTDTLIPYQEVVAGLHNKESYIYLSLFNTSKWRQRCGEHYPGAYPAISEKEFFQRTPEEKVEFDEIENDWVKVTFRPGDKTIYPRCWIFQKVESAWKLANGFIVSRCSCG